MTKAYSKMAESMICMHSMGLGQRTKCRSPTTGNADRNKYKISKGRAEREHKQSMQRWRGYFSLSPHSYPNTFGIMYIIQYNEVKHPGRRKLIADFLVLHRQWNLTDGPFALSNSTTLGSVSNKMLFINKIIKAGVGRKKCTFFERAVDLYIRKSFIPRHKGVVSPDLYIRKSFVPSHKGVVSPPLLSNNNNYSWCSGPTVHWEKLCTQSQTGCLPSTVI